LVDFLWWKGSTHIIAQTNAKRTDQNGLETTNRLKNERVKQKNVKNTSRTQRVILLPNPGGHKEDSGPPFPLQILVLTQIKRICGPLSHKHLRGGETLTRIKKMQIEEMREMRAPSSYLTGFLHNLSFAPRYN
jgi:hypothetical protein